MGLVYVCVICPDVHMASLFDYIYGMAHRKEVGREMRKPRVYLTNNKGLDMSSAAVYGDIVTLFDKTPPNLFATSTIAYTIKQKLADAEPSDYVIVGGNSLLCLITFGILYEKHGFVNLLLYDIRNNTYEPRVLPRHQLSTGGKNV